MIWFFLFLLHRPSCKADNSELNKVNQDGEQEEEEGGEEQDAAEEAPHSPREASAQGYECDEDRVPRGEDSHPWPGRSSQPGWPNHQQEARPQGGAEQAGPLLPDCQS